MQNFEKNEIKLNSESVSEVLTITREQKGIKKEQAAKDLNINIKYINALESGDFDVLPDGIYGKNYLRDYSSYLGLDAKEVVSLFEQDKTGEQQNSRKDLFSKKIPKPHYFLSVPRIIRNVFIVMIILVCVLYLGFYIKNIISPPPLQVISPTDNFTTSSSNITILGKTDKKASVTINQENVLIDENGNFSKNISLKKGVNTITVTAQKKYSKTKQIDRLVLVK